MDSTAIATPPTDSDTATTPNPGKKSRPTRKPKAPAATRQAIKVVPDEGPPHGDVIVDQAALADALGTLRTVADAKATMPMLQNVLIRPSDGGIDITATDLNVYMTVHVPTTTEARKALCVNARKLLDIARAMPTGPVRINRIEGPSLATVNAGRVKVTVETMLDRDYPKIPTCTAWSVQLDGKTLKDMLERVEFSVCQDETRFHLNGVYFKADGFALDMVTTDGHRLTKAKRTGVTATDTWDKPLRTGVIVPSKACAELRKMLDASAPCDVACDGKYLYVKQGWVTLATKLIDAQFPPYEQVIPTEHRSLVTVDRKALIEACKRSKIAASDSRGLALVADEGTLTLQGGDGDAIRDMSEEIDAEYVGERKRWGVNPQYLLELLVRIDDTRVVIAFGSELDPCLVRSVDDATMRRAIDSNLLGVIMPMRL